MHVVICPENDADGETGKDDVQAKRYCQPFDGIAIPRIFSLQVNRYYNLQQPGNNSCDGSDCSRKPEYARFGKIATPEYPVIHGHNYRRQQHGNDDPIFPGIKGQIHEG